MSRLIDADKLIEDLTNTINEWIADMPDGEYLKGNVNFSVVARDMILKQPTAYDVDMVVGKLKHSQYMLFEETKKATSYSHKEELIENIRHYENAINIVKAGRV